MTAEITACFLSLCIISILLLWLCFCLIQSLIYKKGIDVPINNTIKTLSLALFLGLSLNAQAAIFGFSYTSGAGTVLAGTVDGVLQGDGNSVFVTSVEDFVTVDGVDQGQIQTVDSISNFISSTGASPTLTLDGSFLDFCASVGTDCADGQGFTFDSNGGSFGVVSFGFGDLGETYNSANWNMSAVSAVPVPAAAWLMGSALVGLFGFRKKKS